MKRISTFIALLLFTSCLFADSHEICFSPVSKRHGERGVPIEPGKPHIFDYSIQLDDGPVIKPSSTQSTSYKYTTEEPMMKIYNAGKLVASFKIHKSLIQEGRNCVLFNNFYETWQIAEKWQAKKLCGCDDAI